MACAIFVQCIAIKTDRGSKSSNSLPLPMHPTLTLLPTKKESAVFRHLLWPTPPDLVAQSSFPTTSSSLLFLPLLIPCIPPHPDQRMGLRGEKDGPSAWRRRRHKFRDALLPEFPSSAARQWWRRRMLRPRSRALGEGEGGKGKFAIKTEAKEGRGEEGLLLLPTVHFSACTHGKRLKGRGEQAHF